MQGKSKAYRIQFYLNKTFFLGIFLLTSLFINTVCAQSIPAQFGLSPDNSHGLLLKTLKRAKKEVAINIYQLSEPHILTAISELMKKNIAVHILLEGQPAPINRYTNEVKAIVRSLQKAIAQSPKPSLHKLFVMMKRFNSTQTRRFVYNHAKYVVIDRRLSLITSENFTATGHPLAGNVGNRGWEVVLDDPTFAHQLLTLFHEDSRLEFSDVADLTPKTLDPSADRDSLLIPTNDSSAQTPPARTVSNISIASGEVKSATLLTAPNAVSPIQKLLRSAKTSIALEYMSLPQAWMGTSKEPPSSDVVPTGTNPVVGELMRAAQKGAQVRVLLNDDRVFSRTPGKKLPNFLTASFLEKTAKCFSLPLEARIVDVKATQITYVHNKGILVDDFQTLVSSINGTKNSYLNNREIAVLLNSTDANRYYGKAFDWDWEQSPSLNQTLEQTPVTFPLPPSPCASLTQATFGSFGSLLSAVFR